MASANSLWDAPSMDIIAPLVSHLKHTRRWSRDAPSLRALNRHWCVALNRHVVEVKPHQSRDLFVEDIHSLAKFHSLTVLDACPFEGSGNNVDSRCCMLAQTLCQLPRLAKLHVKSLLDHVSTDNCQFLNCITSLDFKESWSADCGLSKISQSKLQQLVGSFDVEGLIEFLLRTPTMKSLVMAISPIDLVHRFDEFVASTARLEALRLSTCRPPIALNLHKLQNLVALELLGYLEQESLEPLLNLPKLTSLKLSCLNSRILRSSALKPLIERLVSLQLHCGCFFPLNEAIVDSTTLKHLTLGQFAVGRRALEDLGNRPSLSLSLLNCRLEADASCAGDLPALKDLLINEHSAQSGLPKMFLSSARHLEQLELSLKNKRLDVKLLTEIHSLKNLVSLSIFADIENSLCGPDLFEAFEKLGDLPHLLFLSLSRQISLPVFLKIINMELVTKLEELVISVRRLINKRVVEYKVNALRSKAPHLKLYIKFY